MSNFASNNGSDLSSLLSQEFGQVRVSHKSGHNEYFVDGQRVERLTVVNGRILECTFEKATLPKLPIEEK